MVTVRCATDAPGRARLKDSLDGPPAGSPGGGWIDNMQSLIVFSLFLLVLVPAVLLLVRRHRQQAESEELSPITRQHIDLFQGGQLSEGAVESAKARFRDLLERGEVE